MTRSLAFAFLLPLGLLASAGGPGRAAETITPNDNRQPAGTFANGVLTVALEARDGTWQPEGEHGRALDVAAFAEEGKGLSTPGPFIRVRLGTEIRATVRNRLARQISLIGLSPTHSPQDSTVIAPGAVARVQFKASTPGTFYYAARSGVDPIGARFPEDAQLHGIIVVDPPNAPAGRSEHVFGISWYCSVVPASPTGLGRCSMALNGLSWPHTTRLDYTQGDSVHWRVVNFTELDHPMHLHGFYFRMESKGDGVNDSIYTPAQRRMAVTEVIPPFNTMSFSWYADRPGNWIYHCHYATHLSNLVSLDTENGQFDESMLDHHMADKPHQMYGLVIGMTVAPKGSIAQSTIAPRKIRIQQREKPNVYGNQPGMSFVMDGTPEAASTDALSIPGPTLFLERGKPVAITVVNQSNDHASVHWHGIELESYPDGVPGWSGSGTNILPSIKPHDSLTVRWTPPRAGSFMYHSHFNESQQMGRGLYGPIIVLEPGQRFDAETDRILFFGTEGISKNVVFGPFPNYVMNGKAQPEAMNLKAGVRYRFRLFNLAGDAPTFVTLKTGDKPVDWRLVAKDGYPLPASQIVARPAALVFDPGEIYDYEFTPSAAGEWTLTFGPPPFLVPPAPPPGSPPGPPVPQPPPTVSVPVHVR